MTTVILDPTDERVPIQRQLTARPAILTNSIGLLDISKPRGNVLIDRLEALITDRLPEVTVRRYKKPAYAKPAPEALRNQILEECDFIVEALAD